MNGYFLIQHVHRPTCFRCISHDQSSAVSREDRWVSVERVASPILQADDYSYSVTHGLMHAEISELRLQNYVNWNEVVDPSAGWEARLISPVR